MSSFSLFGNAFAEIVGGGRALLLPYAMAMAQGLLAIAIALYAVSIAFSSSGPMLGAVRLMIAAGFWLVCITGAQPISEGLLGGAVQFGMLAGGRSINPDTFLRSPDTIFVMGFAHAKSLFEMADQVCAAQWGGCMASLGSYLPLVIAAWTVTGAFIVLATSVELTYILFHIFSLLAVLMMPAALLDAISWLGMGPVRALVHTIVQIFVLAFAVSLGSMVFAKLELGHVPGVSASLPFIIASVFLTALTLAAQRKAYSLTHGAMMSAGSMFSTPLAMAAAGGRSAAGHLDGPVSKAGIAAGGLTYKAIAAAVSANANSLGTMTSRTAASVPAKRP